MTGIATKTVEIGPINRNGFFVAFKVSHVWGEKGPVGLTKKPE